MNDSQSETQVKLEIWKAVAGHILAFTLTVGFFGIVFVALFGYAQITDPTTAQFIGTVTGYAIGKLERPLAYYFAVSREHDQVNGTIKEHK